jgi:type I restriction enzyme S subunit
VNPNFLAYALTAEHFVSQVESRSNGISYPAINASDLVSIAIPVPPLEEQLLIAHHLDNQLKKLDALVTATNEAIDRLNERRSALVAAAVTGKVDVWGKN